MQQTIYSLLSLSFLLLFSFWLTLIIAPCGVPLTFVHKWVAHAVDQATNNNNNNYYLRLSHAPLSLPPPPSLCHPRRRMTFAYMLFKWEWHYVAHIFHGIARHRPSSHLSAELPMMVIACHLPSATCKLPPDGTDHLPPAVATASSTATATTTASCCWCQLQMRFSAVAACKSERPHAYATAKCPFSYNQRKKKKPQLPIQLSCHIKLVFYKS